MGEGVGRAKLAYRRNRRHRTTSPRSERQISPLICADDTDRKKQNAYRGLTRMSADRKYKPNSNETPVIGICRVSSLDLGMQREGWPYITLLTFDKRSTGKRRPLGGGNVWTSFLQKRGIQPFPKCVHNKQDKN